MDFSLQHLVSLSGVLIPLAAIVMGIGIAMFAIWTDYNRKREMFELLHKERLLAIERGMEVPPLPPDFFQSERCRRGPLPSDSLRRGLTWLLVGIALIVALAWNRSPESATWGLIPVAVGLAHLISYAVAARNQSPS